MSAEETLARIKDQVESNAVVIYMKGTPQFPQCGFSSRAAAALAETGEEFGYINIIQDPLVFEHLPKYAEWPTFPQIYIGGELIGGCDITMEMAESGELKTAMAEAVEKAKANSAE